MYHFLLSFIFIFVIGFKTLFAGLYEGINLYEQQKYADAYEELYPLKGFNIYAHPYILDLYKNHHTTGQNLI